MSLYNPLVYEVGEIIETFVGGVGIPQGRCRFARAVGLFRSATRLTLMPVTNALSQRLTSEGGW